MRFVGLARARLIGVDRETVLALRRSYPAARSLSADGRWLLCGGGPKRLGCVYTLVHIASRAQWTCRTLAEVQAVCA